MTFFSVVITSLNGEKALPPCLSALFKTRWKDFEVILVDNGSTDGTSEMVRQGWGAVKIIRAEKNLGFAGGNNLGMRAAKGDWIVLLNDDTEVHPGWLQALDEVAALHKDAGILGCKLLYPDGKTIQHAGGWIEPNGLTHHKGYGEEDKGQYNELKECEYVTGAAFAMKREAIQKIGLLDEKFFPIYFEEIDFCTRAVKEGYKIYYVPRAVVIHHESRTTGKFSPGFLFKYNKNRWRYLFKNKSFPELLRAARHELKWLVKNRPKDIFIPLIKSYAAVLPQLPGIFWGRIFKRTRGCSRE
jgi:GT2 family glycosyltransferase